MTTRQTLERFGFVGGFDSSLQPLDPRTQGLLAEGSFNVQNIDNGRNIPFMGLESQGAGTGSRIMTTIGNTWGGIKDITVANKTFTSGDVSTASDTITIASHGFVTGVAFTFTTAGTLPTPFTASTPTYYIIVIDTNTISVASSYSNALAGTVIDITAVGSGTSTINVAATTVPASGTVFQDVGASIWGIGSGQPHIEGTNLTKLQLSSLLKILLAVGGSYNDTASGPFVAGLSQPSSPGVAVMDTPTAGFQGLINGAVSFKLARFRIATGAISTASSTSAVVVPAQKTVRITFPAAATGQTYWQLFATQQGYGGVGIHYLLPYNGSNDIPESLIASSTVDGIARSIEIDYMDADLQSIEAYTDDFPPPAGTQAARIESSMVVFGCYSDSTVSPSSSTPGTCAAVSLPNYPESFKPRHILYFPEPIVAILSRLIDSYCYVLCRNSIHAVQFVGWRDQLPSCTVTTVSPDLGVSKPNNAIQAYGRLFLWAEKSGPVAMNNDGSLDYSFGSPIRKYTQNWDDSTVVGFDPITRSVTYSNGVIMFLYCLQSGSWSSPVYLSDYASGTALASATTRGEQILALSSGGVATAYKVNKGATSAPVLYASNFSEANTKRGKNLYELIVSGEFPKQTPLFIGLHRNFRGRVYRDATTTSASSTIGSASAMFTPADEGNEVFVLGANVGNRTFPAIDVSIGGDSVIVTANGLLSGQPVTFTSSGTLPGGITAGVTYYVLPVDADVFQIYTDPNDTTSLVNITSQGTGTHTVVINYLVGKISNETPTSFTITKLDGSALTAGASTTGSTLIIAEQVFMQMTTDRGYQDLYSVYPQVNDARQFSVTCAFDTNARSGQIMSIEALGVVDGVSEMNL